MFKDGDGGTHVFKRNDPSPSITLCDVTANKVLVLMSKQTQICRICGVELTDNNWYSSCRKKHHYICKRCELERIRAWKKANPEKAKAAWTRVHRKQGHCSFSKNRECAAFLGVYIAEEVLSQAFKDVVRMPYGNPGYDFKCRYGYLVDVKSSCLDTNGRWLFRINHNTVADYFLCLAFDNRESLNPEHLWLLPGDRFNHYVGTSISPSTIDKWSEYELDISKVSECRYRGD